MNLNRSASGLEPQDMTDSDEFQSLLASATDLGINHNPQVRYVSRQVVLRQHRFQVLEWGDPGNPPLVLLHGAHQSAHSWDLVSLALARRYHVVALDQRGHGDSEWARDADYAPQTMAADAKALIETLELAHPVVIGHSMGGRVTLRLALAEPELCRALVIVDSGPELSEVGRRAIGRFIADNEVFDDLEQFVANVQRYDPYRSAAHIRRTVKYNLFRRADGKYVSKCDRASRRLAQAKPDEDPDAISLAHVKTLPMPTLVLRGERSSILSAELAERFVNALPQGQLQTVPACGHNVHSQNTPGFLAALAPFLADCCG